MNWQWTPYTIPLMVAAATSVISAFYILRHRHTSSSRTGVLILLACADWIMGYALELASADLLGKFFWAKVKFVATCIMPTAWLIYILQYTGREKWLTRRTLALLSIVPFIFLLLIFTNEAHSLIWHRVWLDTDGPFSVMGSTYGPGLWVYMVYSYTLVLAGIFLLIQALVRSGRLYRWQASALLLAVFTPWLANAVLDLSNLNPFPHLELTPVALGLTAPVVAWSLARLRRGDIVSVSRGAILGGMSDGVMVLDARNRIVDLNPAAQRLIGHTLSEAIGQPVGQLWSEWPVLMERCWDGAEAGREVVLGKGDGQRTYDVGISPLVDWRGHLISQAVVLRDITERKRAEEALRKSKERYALAARGANDGLWDWDLKTNEVYFSPRWKSMLGYEESEIGDSLDEWFGRVHPEELDRVNMELSAHLEGLTRHFEKEHRMLHKDGTYRWMLTRGLAIRDADGNAYRMAGSQTDITERKRVEKQLLHDAFHDALTGLLNRALFMDRLGRSVERAKRRDDYLFAVLFMDLDCFKNVNDSLGHTIGDELLIASARRLERCLRPSDTVARLGGDEFVILLEDIRDISDATRVTGRIQEQLALPFKLNGHEVFTSASIGIVLSETGYGRPEDILQDADIAMYRAKVLGKARHELFDRAMRARIMARLELERDLRRAVERQEFQVHYQPVLSLETGRITGFEALVRWQHPDRGLVSPMEFISVAEETGLIIPIDRWVLREACRQMREWQARFPADPPLTISVNLSGKHFAQPDLIEHIEQVLQETGLDARRLKLEMTESMIMADVESATGMLMRLRALGVELQIDDFGTGYSALSYLQRIPIDAIKIDRSFVSRMGVNGDNSRIIKAIVTLARDLGMDVIAEGVETAEQLAQLRTLECEYGQGYFISRPLDSEAAAALMAEALAVDVHVTADVVGLSAFLRPGWRRLELGTATYCRVS